MAENDLVKKKPGPKKPHSANFKLGNPGGPGRPPIPEDIKLVRKKFQELREQNSLEMQLMIDNLRRLPNVELEALYLTEIPCDQAIIIKGLLMAREKSDLQVIQTLRTITAGAEVKQVELPEAEKPSSRYRDVTPDQRLAIYQRLKDEIRELECQMPSSRALSESLALSEPQCLDMESSERKSDD